MPTPHTRQTQPRHEKSAFEILKALVDKNPRASELELAKAFEREVREADIEGGGQLSMIIRSWFYSTYPRLRPRPRADSRKQVEEKKQEIKGIIRRQAEMLLLEMVMPNGKKLKDCTGADCRKAGGWLTRVGEVVGPRQKVGTALTEKEVRSFFSKA